MVEQRARARRVRPTLRSVMLLLPLAAGGAACAAILGIDQRDLIGSDTEAGDASNDTSSDGPSDGDAGSDRSDAPDGTLEDTSVPRLCEPASCALAGGACDPVTSTCTFDCSNADAGCTGTKACPAGNDCRFLCNAGNACNGMKCTGDRSCTFVCSASNSCKMGVACAAQRCTFDCLGSDSCKDDFPITCEAGVCITNCASKNSCNRGVFSEATTYCRITCTGAPSCAGAPLFCSAPDASIDCAPGSAATCVNVKPSCTAEYCTLRCGNTASCGASYCCDAGTCVTDTGVRTNVCP